MPAYLPKLNGSEYAPGAIIETDGPATFTIHSDIRVEGITLNSGQWIQAGHDASGDAFLVLPIGRYYDVIAKHAGGKHGYLTSFELVQRVAPVPAPEPAYTAPLGTINTPGQVIANANIRTQPWGGGSVIGINPVADNVQIKNVTFAPNGGFLTKINGKGCTIDGLTATTFNAYAIFAEGAENFTARNVNIVGGSRSADGTAQGESILRFGDCKNVLIEDSTFDYRPVPAALRKACIRGNISGGVFNRVKAYGAVVGVTCMTGFDAGEGYLAGGKLRIIREPWIINLDNQAEWMAVVKQIVAEGVTDQAAILTKAMQRCVMKVREGGAVAVLQPSAVDVARTVQDRKEHIGQRSDMVMNDSVLEAPIRNSAGSVQTYNRCTINGDIFSGWNEPTYPEPQYLLPGDVSRPFPVTTLNACALTSSTLTLAAFNQFCVDWKIARTGCTFNGTVVPDLSTS